MKRSRELRLCVIGCLVMVACSLGCNRGKPRRFAKPKPPDFRQLATLPGLAKSGDPALVDEIARLRSEEATPAQLAAIEGPVDVAARMELREEFPVQRVTGLLEDIAKIYPRGRFVFNSASEQRAADLLKHEAQLFDKAIAQAEVKDSLKVDHAQGLLADLHIYDIAELAHRGQALRVQMAIAQGNIREAIERTCWMLQLDHRLATLAGVVPRLKGANLRLEALRVVEAVVQDQSAADAAVPEFRDLLHVQLADWPDDATAWIGDRAQGLHTYEMIRHGMVLSVFTDDELKELSDEAGVSATAKAIVKDVDADERFYLATMRDVIAACVEPYHVRRNMLERITANLQRDRGAPEFPMVAGRILLVDLQGGHRLQATDRAACEGWWLALCAATEAPTPDVETNPETGATYQLEMEATRVVLRNARAGEPDEAIIVPKVAPPMPASAQAINPTTSRGR